MHQQISIIFILLTLLAGCKQQPAPTDPIPEHDTFKIESSVLGETRVICVWTPPSYNNSLAPMPVLYMPDGGIREDFPHIANTLAKLVAENTLPDTILVGIENTERRRDLTGPSDDPAEEQIAPLTDGSSKFRQFIADELFSEVERRYRITGKKAIIGESAAGLFVVESMFLEPDMFDAYIAMDPSIYWNHQFLVRTASEHLSEFPESSKRFWFAGSDAEDIQTNTRELKLILEQHAPETLTWLYSDQPNEQHSTIFRATKEQALKWTLGTDFKE